MAFTVEYIYKALDAFTPVTEKINQAIKNVERGAGNLQKKLDSVGKSMKRVGGDLTIGVSAPLAILSGLALKNAANFETMAVSFESMLGSADKSRELMKDLTDFSAKTPFRLPEIGQATKQLLAYGVAQEDMVGTLSRLGDIAAGANIPLTDMAQIFGKSKAKGKLMTEELLQLSERGIPVIDVLAKRFNVSKDVIFEAASKSQISFKMLEESITTMTSKGGIFFEQMGKQSQTLSGIFSTFSDNVSIALADIGNIIIETFDLKTVMTNAIEWMGKMVASIRTFTKEHPKLTKFIVIMGAILAILGPVVFAIGTVAVAVAGLITILSTAAAAAGVTVGAVVAVAGGIVIAITAIGAAMIAAFVYWDEIEAMWDNFKKWASDSIDAVVEKAVAFKDGIINVFKMIGSFILNYSPFSLLLNGLEAIGKVTGVLPTATPSAVPVPAPAMTPQRSSVDINMMINDRAKAVQSTAIKTKGSPNFNLGNNMR